jgi:Dolichyl-phosphate-mannose-protein mannosyltransferase
MFRQFLTSISTKTKTNYYWIIPLLTCLAFWTYWFMIDNTPPHWDGGRHVYNAENYFTLFKNILIKTKENGRTDALIQFLSQYFYYPPLEYYLTIPFFAVFGVSAKSAVLTNILWILLLTFGCVQFLRTLKVSNLGIMVVLFFLFGSPFLIGQSREYQLDYPLLAILFVGFWRLQLWLKSFDFRNSVWLVVVIGLGILTKWTFVITFGLLAIPVVAVEVVGRLYPRHFVTPPDRGIPRLASFVSFISKLKKLAQNIGALAFVVWGIVGAWYIPNLSHLIIDFKQNSGNIGIVEGDPQGITWQSLLFYMNTLTAHYLTFGWVLVFIILGALVVVGRFWGFKNNNNGDIKIAPTLSFGSSIFKALPFVLSFIIYLLYLMNQGNKDTRYAIGFFVIFAVLLGVGFDNLNSRFRKFFVGLVVVVSLFCMVSLNFQLSSKESVAELAPKTFLTIIPTTGYTNLTTGNRSWAVYDALNIAEMNAKTYRESYDSCISSDYWKPLPTIKVDFIQQPTHTNVGTVWGLAREYGLEWSDQQDSCFVLLGGQNMNEVVTKIADYPNYTQIGEFHGFEQENIIVLKKN